MIERGGEGAGGRGNYREEEGGMGRRGLEKEIKRQEGRGHSLGSAQNIHVPVLMVISKLLVAQHTQAPPVEVVGVGT